MSDGNANPFANMMQQVQEAQANIKKLQEDLNAQEIVGEAGAGLVKIIGTGGGDIKSIDIDDSVMTGSKQQLEGLMIAAMNDWHQKRNDIKAGALKTAFAGFPIPPGMDLPG